MDLTIFMDIKANLGPRLLEKLTDSRSNDTAATCIFNSPAINNNGAVYNNKDSSHQSRETDKVQDLQNTGSFDLLHVTIQLLE